MGTKDNGGPAFGQVVELRCVRVDPNGTAEYEPEAMLHGGLTVRDYFAAKALQAFLSVPASIQAMGEAAEAGGEAKAAFAAGMAYEIADSMLAERAK